jgi:hypothetical protein
MNVFTTLEAAVKASQAYAKLNQAHAELEALTAFKASEWRSNPFLDSDPE